MHKEFASSDNGDWKVIESTLKWQKKLHEVITEDLNLLFNYKDYKRRIINREVNNLTKKCLKPEFCGETQNI